jgi:hydroxymethylpyrimidine pyrophosphatase-like HAD family hydrolase
MYRRIVTDLDGTLLTDDRVVSYDTIDTLRTLSALGEAYVCDRSGVASTNPGN